MDAYYDANKTDISSLFSPCSNTPQEKKTTENLCLPEYIDYNQDLADNFYSIEKACEILHINKEVLASKCRTYNIRLSRDVNGSIGLCQHSIRSLHNTWYKECNHWGDTEENERLFGSLL